MENAGDSPPISNSAGKSNKTHCVGITWEIVTHTFLVDAFVPLDSYCMVYFITSKICGFLHQLPIASENGAKPMKWGEAWGVDTHTFSVVWMLFSIKVPSCGILHHMGNAWVSPPVSHCTRKCNKVHRMGRTWEIGTHTFPIVWVLFLISLLSYGILHQMGNTWYFPSISCSIGKRIKIYRMERAWEIGTHIFPKGWVLFFYQIPVQWYTLPHAKFMGFLINFP